MYIFSFSLKPCLLLISSLGRTFLSPYNIGSTIWPPLTDLGFWVDAYRTAAIHCFILHKVGVSLHNIITIDPFFCFFLLAFFHTEIFNKLLSVMSTNLFVVSNFCLQCLFPVLVPVLLLAYIIIQKSAAHPSIHHPSFVTSAHSSTCLSVNVCFCTVCIVFATQALCVLCCSTKIY